MHLKRATPGSQSCPVRSESDDRGFCELVRDELADLEVKQQVIARRLQDAMTVSDPKDRRNVVVEIRAGAGGDEAALFAAVLFRMYSQYADRCGWTIQLVDAHETEIGGFKEIVFLWKAMVPTAGCALKAAFTAYSVCRLPNRAAGFTLQLSRWRSCRKLMMWK